MKAPAIESLKWLACGRFPTWCEALACLFGILREGTDMGLLVVLLGSKHRHHLLDALV
jgi:hypothetical protein